MNHTRSYRSSLSQAGTDDFLRKIRQDSHANQHTHRSHSVVSAASNSRAGSVAFSDNLGSVLGDDVEMRSDEDENGTTEADAWLANLGFELEDRLTSSASRESSIASTSSFINTFTPVSTTEDIKPSEISLKEQERAERHRRKREKKLERERRRDDRSTRAPSVSSSIFDFEREQSSGSMDGSTKEMSEFESSFQPLGAIDEEDEDEGESTERERESPRLRLNMLKESPRKNMSKNHFEKADAASSKKSKAEKEKKESTSTKRGHPQEHESEGEEDSMAIEAPSKKTKKAKEVEDVLYVRGDPRSFKQDSFQTSTNTVKGQIRANFSAFPQAPTAPQPTASPTRAPATNLPPPTNSVPDLATAFLDSLGTPNAVSAPSIDELQDYEDVVDMEETLVEDLTKLCPEAHADRLNPTEEGSVRKWASKVRTAMNMGGYDHAPMEDAYSFEQLLADVELLEKNRISFNTRKTSRETIFANAKFFAPGKDGYSAIQYRPFGAFESQRCSLERRSIIVEVLRKEGTPDFVPAWQPEVEGVPQDFDGWLRDIQQEGISSLDVLDAFKVAFLPTLSCQSYAPADSFPQWKPKKELEDCFRQYTEDHLERMTGLVCGEQIVRVSCKVKVKAEAEANANAEDKDSKMEVDESSKASLARSGFESESEKREEEDKAVDLLLMEVLAKIHQNRCWHWLQHLVILAKVHRAFKFLANDPNVTRDIEMRIEHLVRKETKALQKRERELQEAEKKHRAQLISELRTVIDIKQREIEGLPATFKNSNEKTSKLRFLQYRLSRLRVEDMVIVKKEED